jgi:hypothetical protein
MIYPSIGMGRVVMIVSDKHQAPREEIMLFDIFHEWLDGYLAKNSIDVQQPITGLGSDKEVPIHQVVTGIKSSHPAKQSAMWQKFRLIDKSNGNPIPYLRYLIDEVEVPVGELV